MVFLRQAGLSGENVTRMNTELTTVWGYVIRVSLHLFPILVCRYHEALRGRLSFQCMDP